MENQICTTDEAQWNDQVRKRLHKIKITLDILLGSVLGILALAGLHIYVSYGLDPALEQLACLSAFLIMPVMLCVCASVCDSLDNCYRQYRCKAFGYVHRPMPDELNSFNGHLHCPQCSRNTAHKKVPLNKNHNKECEEVK